jgi:hypothetical protein
MPENIPLQQRAGRNIGVQVLPPYLHDAAMPEIAVNPTGVTTIMEGKDEVVRTPSIRVFAGNFAALNLWGYWGVGLFLNLCYGEKIILRGSLVQN